MTFILGDGWLPSFHNKSIAIKKDRMREIKQAYISAQVKGLLKIHKISPSKTQQYTNDERHPSKN